MSVNVDKVVKVYRNQYDYHQALNKGEISPDEISYISDDLYFGEASLPVTESFNWTTAAIAGHLDYDDIFNNIVKRFNKIVPTIEHKCHNCGGTLEIKPDQGIFKCPYCRSVYAIGTQRVNDRG